MRLFQQKKNYLSKKKIILDWNEQTNIRNERERERERERESETFKMKLSTKEKTVSAALGSRNAMIASSVKLYNYI